MSKRSVEQRLTTRHNRGIEVPAAAEALRSPGWYAGCDGCGVWVILSQGNDLIAIPRPYVKWIDWLSDAKPSASREEVVELKIAVQERCE